MLKTIDTYITAVDGLVRNGNLSVLLALAGTVDTYYANPCLAFWSDSDRDMQELDLINQILGNIGDQWYSTLRDQEVRLIVDIDPVARNEFSVKTLAVGHKKNDKKDETESFDDDHFVLLNSGLPIMSEAEVYRRILHPGVEK